MDFIKITEQDSLYDALENQSVSTLLQNIHKEDKTITEAIEKVLPNVEELINKVVRSLKNGGRLFYIGAGTSGRLGVLDASECLPTFGVSDKIIGIIAGGMKALSNPVEGAEDSKTQGWKDLNAFNISKKDVVIGISASGTTPYVLATLDACKEKGILTGSICANPNSPISKVANYPIEVIVGPEFITGSTRMKAGTAQKILLNMISTVTMIRLGHVKGNQMIDLQMTNQKLKIRAEKILSKELGISQEKSKNLLIQNKSIREIISTYKK